VKKQNKCQKKLIPIEIIQQKIYFIRGEKVMFDRDLAVLYGAETKVLNQAVKRNLKRFPSDFMFRLNKSEMQIWTSQIVIYNENLRSQFVTLKRGHNIKYAPYVFTEQGVSMLSSVLNSERAIQVNIQIMRTFTKLRKMLMTYKELREKIETMEKKYDKKFRVVFEAIGMLIREDEKPKKRIGFKG
jgi:hypothetical protein